MILYITLKIPFVHCQLIFCISEHKNTKCLFSNFLAVLRSQSRPEPKMLAGAEHFGLEIGSKAKHFGFRLNCSARKIFNNLRVITKASLSCYYHSYCRVKKAKKWSQKFSYGLWKIRSRIARLKRLNSPTHFT